LISLKYIEAATNRTPVASQSVSWFDSSGRFSAQTLLNWTSQQITELHLTTLTQATSHLQMKADRTIGE